MSEKKVLVSFFKCCWQVVWTASLMCGKSFVYLRLGEHVQTPGAHPAICGHGDQVVGVLCADHIHAVHWVLDKHTHDHTQRRTNGLG